MKFLLLSDIHATSQTPRGRLDDISEAFRQKFSHVCRYANDNSLIILQAGDLTHRPRDLYVLNDIVKILRKYTVGLNCVFGQHDMYMRNKNSPTIMGTLKNIGMTNILNQKSPYYIDEDDQMIGLFGASIGDEIPEPEEGYDRNILVLHKNISLNELYPHHNYTSPKHFIRKNPGWDLILVGDIHRYFVVRYKNTLLVNTGPMIRYEATKYNFSHKPCFFVYDSILNNVQKMIIPHMHSKLVLSRDHIKEDSKEDALFEELAEQIEKLNNLEKEREKINIEEEVLKMADKIKNMRTKRLLKEIIKHEE